MQRFLTGIFIVVFAACLFCLPINAASPVSSYLALRKQHKITGSVDYAYLQANIGSLAGRVVEVRGTVTGTAQSESGCTFILDTGPDHKSVTIVTDKMVIPELTPGAPLRVLAKLPADAFCLSKLDLVALVEEYAVAPYDPKPAPKPVVQTAEKTAVEPTQAHPGAGTRAQRGDEVTARGAADVLAAYRNAVLYFNKRLSKSQADTIARHILNYSYNNGVDARLVMAVIAVESGFNPAATSRAGAMGLGQLMPGTARGLGVSNAYNIEENVAGATRLIRGHLEKYQGKPVWEQISLAMACYNAGSGAVKKYGGVPPYRETRNYVKKVAVLYKKFIGAD